MNNDIEAYNRRHVGEEIAIFNRLATIIEEELSDAESKIWHRHPVWFLDGNPIVGYVKQKKGIRLMFWSGADFDEDDLVVRGGKFMDASIFYNSLNEINPENL